LIKADTPLTTAKISRMLHHIEFKLQIEKQYKQGIDKMAALYQAEGDRKSRSDAESKRVESQSKIMLLQQALKRYKQLHVMDDEADNDGRECRREAAMAMSSNQADPIDAPSCSYVRSESSSIEGRRQDLRKPLSGTLQISVKAARDLEHAPTQRLGRSVRESTVVFKVEDAARARTHPSRTDRWQDDFEFAVDNANEIEVTVYDKVGSGHPVPVGMLWIRLSDVVEELRKKKFGQPGASDGGSAAASGWVTAGDVQQQAGGMMGGASAGYPSSSASDYSFNQPAGAPVPLGPPAEGIEAWFAVEPAGAVFLHINFQKQNIQRRAYEARLGRQGAFRKKKDDVAEINGHKFVSRQFYQIIRCALCGELLLNAAGSQCEDCRYTCHKKCAQKVVTKCISKSNAEADRDEVKINHRIPHRFEPITNIGANWCCHCGYILPFGRKNAKKCSECDITCHSDCAHLVPDFCGMSMEMANQLLSDIETINRVKHTAKQQQQQQTQQQRQQGQSQIMPPKVGAQAPSQQLGGTQDNAYGYGAGRQQQQAGANGGAAAVGGPRPYDAPVEQLEQRTSQMDLASRPTDGPYGAAAAAASPARPRPPPVDPVYASGAAPGPPQYGLPSQDSGPPTGPQIGQVFNQQQYQQSEMAKPPRPLPLPGTAGRPMAPPPVSQAPPPAQQQMQQQQQPLPPAQQARRPQPPGPGAMVPSTSASSQIVGAAPAQPPRNPPSSKRKIGLNDFNFLAVLGKGNFGKVMLAEEKRSGNLYAIKVLKKEFIIENDEVESTKSEKRVFLAAARERHPFLLGLHSCFQTETRVYFVMEYVSGGDLMLHIQKEQFSPKRAKFYAAEVLLALEYFHKQGIIYRDLKLDNIMLTLDGHVKVGDYGLCKEEMWYGNTTSTFCGTPEFMAPEILLEQRYGRAVDWWAFGILIYEMLLGQAPFRGDDEDEIFDAILEDEPLYPIHMPADSVSILHRLLTRDPAKRLGSGERDAEEIKAHPFFRDTNWDDMFHKRIPAPFKPTLKNPSDTSWFDAEFTSEKPTLTPVHSVLSAQDQEEFASFSWTSTTIL
jgi:classical protein kinase C